MIIRLYQVQTLFNCHDCDYWWEFHSAPYCAICTSIYRENKDCLNCLSTNTEVKEERCRVYDFEAYRILEYKEECFRCKARETNLRVPLSLHSEIYQLTNHS